MVSRNLDSDPIRNFRFRVQIPIDLGAPYGNLVSLGFMSVSGLAATTDPISYREGGDNTTTRKMPGQTDFPPLSLTRGVVGSEVERGLLWQWYRMMFFVIQGAVPFGTNGVDKDFRTDVIVRVMEHPSTALPNPPAAVAWKLYNCWPASLAFSDLDAGGNGIVVNNLTLMYEGFDFFTSRQLAARPFF